MNFSASNGFVRLWKNNNLRGKLYHWQGLIKFNSMSANFNNRRPSLILNN